MNKISNLLSADRCTHLDISLQEFCDSLENELFIVDSNYRIRFANAKIYEKQSAGSKIVIGQLCYEILEGRDTPCASPLWVCPLPAVLQNGKPKEINFSRTSSSTGRQSDLHQKVALFPLHDSRKETHLAVEVRKDISSESKLEKRLLRYHHHIHALNHISQAISEIKDLDNILTICLETALDIVSGEIGGILLLDEKSSMLRYHVYRGFSAKRCEKMQMALGEGIAGKAAQTGKPILIEDVSKDCRVFLPDLALAEGLKGFTAIPLKAKNKVVGVMTIATYTPEKRSKDDLYLLEAVAYHTAIAVELARLYQRLSNTLDRYQTLLKFSLMAQEDERKRIARELHDETTQTLTSLTLNLQALIGMAQINSIINSNFMERLKKAHQCAVLTGNEVVKLMRELRPTLLDTLGLPAAILRYSKDTLQTKNINVYANFKGTERRYPPEIEITFFRIAQGVVGNILEHSEARNAYINMDCNDQECLLTIKDDGKGFDISQITGINESGRGSGLFTIRERLKLVGGNCRVESRPDKGTKIVVRVPMTRGAHDEKN